MNIIECKTPIQILKITASNPLDKRAEYFRITLRQVEIGGKVCFQAEKFKGKQVFHENVSPELLAEWLRDNVEFVYKQVCVVLSNADVTYLFSSNGKCKRLCKATQNKNIQVGSANRSKNYLINEGDNIPALVDLGVFTRDFKIVRQMFDKFKQINRFVEILDDQFKTYSKDEITILDFGCGKSYLTFAMYHFLKVLHGRDVRIIGLDLKKDVIANCSRLAEKLGYSELTFLCGDIADYEGVTSIDMVVTLHACDTATDYALHKAITWNASVILSVPCCQHELNKQIKNEALAPFLKYGLIKERTAALFTDALRGNLLEAAGYQTQILEFIDMEHTPKNILLRAIRKNPLPEAALQKNLAELQPTLELLHAKPTLYELLRQ